MSFVPVARCLSFCMSVIYSCGLTMYILFLHSCGGAPTLIHANDNKGLCCSISSKTIEMNDRSLSVKHHMLNFYFILYINTSVQKQLNKEWKNLKVRRKDIVVDKDNPHTHKLSDASTTVSSSDAEETAHSTASVQEPWTNNRAAFKQFTRPVHRSL